MWGCFKLCLKRKGGARLGERRRGMPFECEDLSVRHRGGGLILLLARIRGEVADGGG